MCMKQYLAWHTHTCNTVINGVTQNKQRKRALISASWSSLLFALCKKWPINTHHRTKLLSNKKHTQTPYNEKWWAWVCAGYAPHVC